MVQLSHPYMTTGKTITLTRQTFVGKVMSLLFNMLSLFVIAFLGSVQSLSRVQLCDPMDYSLPGSSVHGISEARILERVAISFSNSIFPIA